jgi:DNA-binding transcriptional LysR family regulator
VLDYTPLFDEAMLLYCGTRHVLWNADHSALNWDTLAKHEFAGLGYHSPNMELSQRMRLPRCATGFDQESIATLILSGQFLGFLPDHYAESFVRRGLMQSVRPDLLNYACQFFAITRKSPQASRATRAFQECLAQAHTGANPAQG